MLTSTPLDTVLSRLKGVRKSNGGFLAICPAHADANASLSVKESGGRVLLHCFAGCRPEAVAGALGLRMEDLFTDARPRGGNRSSYSPAPPRPAAPELTPQDLAQLEDARLIYAASEPLLASDDGTLTAGGAYMEARGIPALAAAVSGVRWTPDFHPTGRHNGGGPAVVFPFVDALERIVALQCRYLRPVSRGEWRPGDNGRHDAQGVKRMGCFSCGDFTNAEYICVAEAPLDCLSIFSTLGLPGVATGGAAPPPRWMLECIAGRTILLCHDTDAPGEQAALAARDALVSHGHRGRILRLRPPAPAKDWAARLETVGPVAMEAELLDALKMSRRPCCSHLADIWTERMVRARARLAELTTPATRGTR